jgi:hypothetical protein
LRAASTRLASAAPSRNTSRPSVERRRRGSRPWGEMAGGAGRPTRQKRASRVAATTAAGSVSRAPCGPKGQPSHTATPTRPARRSPVRWSGQSIRSSTGQRPERLALRVCRLGADRRPDEPPAARTVLAPSALSALTTNWGRVIPAPNTSANEAMNPRIDTKSNATASAIDLGQPATSRAGRCVSDGTARKTIGTIARTTHRVHPIRWVPGSVRRRARTAVAQPREPAVLAMAGAADLLLVRRARPRRETGTPAALAQRTISRSPVTSSLSQAAWSVA